MVSWKDVKNTSVINKNEVGKEESSASVETSAIGMMDTAVILSTDGREIPVMVDHATRSVYPVRGV